MKKILPIVLVSMLVALAVFGAGCTSSTNSTKLQLAGSTTVQPHAEALAKAFQANNSSVQVFVQGGGSSAGVTAVGTGTADIGMSSANLSKSQLSQYPNLKAVPIAVDGIAIIVNPQNTINNLTLSQTRDIFTGNVTNWNQVGGSDAKINVVNREEGSGTRDGIQKIVLKGGNFSSGGITQSSTGAVRSYVAGDPNAIGYISFAEVDNSVKALSIDGVAPTYATIASGTYPIQRDLLFVTNGAPSGNAKAFIDFTLSPVGQAVLKADKEVSISDASAAKVTTSAAK
jgi:phosphate transport system substrate-binding protein